MGLEPIQTTPTRLTAYESSVGDPGHWEYASHKKIHMDKLEECHWPTSRRNIARLRELLPGCVTEAKGENGSVKLAVDFDQFGGRSFRDRSSRGRRNATSSTGRVSARRC